MSLASTTNPLNSSSHTDDHAYENTVDLQSDFQPDLDDYCWSKQLDGCNIIGNFTRTTIGLSFPVNIDCTIHSNKIINESRDNEANELQQTHFDRYFYERFQHIEVISLNGCGVNMPNLSYNGNYEHPLGIEYIPDPLSVRHLTLEMFKVHGNINGGAFAKFKNTKTILLTNNKIDGLNKDSLDGLNLLEELILQENHIQFVHAMAFKPCDESLKRLVIQENQLILGPLETSKKIEHLVVSTKQMNWTALTIGVESLHSAIVTKVSKILFNETLAPRTFKSLINVEVTFCNIKEFPVDRYPRLLHFNVSHNALQNVSIKEMQMLGLQTLDISYNNFSLIDGVLLASLWDLEYFYAAHNAIMSLNPKSFQKNYILKQIDLRSNRLMRLTIDPALFVRARYVKLIIDDNPFNCAWVNEYYGLDPNIFSSKLIYRKDYTDINIKGLKCHYSNINDPYFHSHLFDADDQHNPFKNPRRPTNPVEILRRNPKHTAMITIFILIIGVSCLLISLFFYVKYRNLTTTLNQEAIYETLPEKRRKSIISNSENRPDIILDRLLTSKHYETPKRQSIVSSSGLEPRSHGNRSSGNIEFKESVDRISERRRTSLANRFETMPIGTQRVVFDIGADTLVI